MLYEDAVEIMNEMDREDSLEIIKTIACVIKAWEDNHIDIGQVKYIIVEMEMDSEWKVDALDAINDGDYEIHYQRPYFKQGIYSNTLILSSELQSSNHMGMSVSYGLHPDSADRLHVWIYPQVDISACKELRKRRDEDAIQ